MLKPQREPTSIHRVAAGIVAVMAMVLASGCTSGVIVDGKFNPLTVNGAVLKFVPTATPNDPTSWITVKLGNTPYVSFDPAAADGATSNSFPGLKNSAQYIPPDNYYAVYVGESLYSSNVFAHSYDGSCTDGLTGKTDKACTQYYFQIFDDTTRSQCDMTNGLPTRNGVKIIPFCPGTSPTGG